MVAQQRTIQLQATHDAARDPAYVYSIISDHVFTLLKP